MSGLPLARTQKRAFEEVSTIHKTGYFANDKRASLPPHCAITDQIHSAQSSGGVAATGGTVWTRQRRADTTPQAAARVIIAVRFKSGNHLILVSSAAPQDQSARWDISDHHCNEPSVPQIGMYSGNRGPAEYIPCPGKTRCHVFGWVSTRCTTVARTIPPCSWIPGGAATTVAPAATTCSHTWLRNSRYPRTGSAQAHAVSGTPAENSPGPGSSVSETSAFAMTRRENTSWTRPPAYVQLSRSAPVGR